MTAMLPLSHVKVEHNYTGTSWQDFTADLAGLQVNLREMPGQHTASLSFYRVNMDPSQTTATTVIKKGDLVRIHAHNSAATMRKMATMRVKNVRVEINLKAQVGRQNRVNVTLIGTGVAGVAGVGRSAGVDTMSELSNIITGAPFEIGGDGFGSGIVAPTGSYTEVSTIDAATELDQILLTRDGNPGVIAYEDPSGTIQVFDSASQRTAAPALTITKANYADIDQQFDMSHIINVVAIKYFEKIKVGKKATRIVEHDVVFENAASIAKYGRFKKTVKVHKKSNFSAYATSVFARNADPENVPASVTIPMRTAADLLPGYEDGHFVGGKVKVTLPDGVTTYTCRVARIQHVIAPDKWTVQVFLRDQNIMHRPHGHSGSRLTSEVGNNPDGAVLTAHLDDGAVTSVKTAYPVIGAIGAVAPTTPKPDDLWIDTGSGNVLKRWNSGTSAWVSAQDTAISTAQATANGKNKVTYSTLDPGAVANTAGDLWFTFTGTIVAKQWQGLGGTSWAQVTVANTVIANLDAAKITTGFLAAARLQAQSIGAEKLVVGDTTNIVVDASADNLGTWAGLSGGWSIATPTVAAPNDRNSKVFRYTANNTYSQMSEALFPVTPGDVYTLSMYRRSVGTLTGAGNIGLFLFFYDSAGTFVGTGTGSLDAPTTSYTTAWTPVPVSASTTVPAGAAFAAPTIRATAGLTAGQYEHDQIFVGRQITGALLVNGAIDGKTITGPVIQTKSNLGTAGVSGMRMEDDVSGGVIKFWTGAASETPGSLNPNLVASQPGVRLTGAGTPTYVRVPYLDLQSGTANSRATVNADITQVNGSVIMSGPLRIKTLGTDIRGIDFAATSVTTNASGDAVVSHNLGVTPVTVYCTSHTGTFLVFRVTALTATTFTVRVWNIGTAAVHASATFTMGWQAIA